jgi:hypothetical protein
VKQKQQIIYQPSVYVERNPDETPEAFHRRVLSDSRLLPDQRTTLEVDGFGGAFADCVRGIWIERPPIIREKPDQGVA